MSSSETHDALVQRIRHLSTRDDLPEALDVCLPAFEAAWRDGGLARWLDLLRRTDQLRERLILAIICLELSVRVGDEAIRLFTLFLITELQSKGPWDLDHFQTFKNSQHIFSDSFQRQLDEVAWAQSEEAQKLRSRQELEYLQLAHDTLLKYIDISRTTARRIAALMMEVHVGLANNDKDHPEGRVRMISKAPLAVEHVDAGSQAAASLAQSLTGFSEGARRYLIRRALTESQALEMTLKEDDELFEAHFGKDIDDGRIMDAWQRLQRFRGGVLLARTSLLYEATLSPEQLFRSLRQWASPHPGQTDSQRLKHFQERVLLDQTLWRNSSKKPHAPPDPAPQPRPASTELGGSPAHATEAILEFVVENHRCVALLTSADRQTPEVIQINLDRASLTRQLTSLLRGHPPFHPARFAGNWRFRESDPVEELDALAPLVSWLPSRLNRDSHLKIVPYGLLHQVPFAALELPGGERLIQRHPVTIQLAPMGSEGVPPADRDSPSRIGGVMLEGEDQRSLVEHLRRIQRLLPGPCELYTGAQATPDAILSGQSGDVFKLLCIQAHGVVRASMPMTHGIALSDGGQLPTPRRTGDRGVLTSEGLMGAMFRGELAILASCLSGTVTRLPGDELLGLLRPLLHGFRHVVTARWAFEVSSGRYLLERFLAAWVEGLGPAHAMAVAKRHMLEQQREPRWRHPYYWAPFFVVGR